MWGKATIMLNAILNRVTSTHQFGEELVCIMFVPAVTKRHGSDTMKYKSTLYIFEWTELNNNNETSLLHLINTLQPNERVKHILYTVTSDNIRFFYNAVVVIEKELESEDK